VASAGAHYQGTVCFPVLHHSHSRSEHAAGSGLSYAWGNTMNRRTAFMLTGVMLFGLAIAALPQGSLAQSINQSISRFTLMRRI